MKGDSRKSLFRYFGYRSFFIVNVIILILLSLSFGREFVRSASIANEISELEAERDRLENRSLSLGDYKDYLTSEAFLEKEAREKFGMQRPGETQVYVDNGSVEGFVGDDVNSPRGVSSYDLNAQMGRGISNVELWKLYFFDAEQYDVAILE